MTIAPPTRADSDRGRYLPGEVVAGRYRMIGMLGRGGMGEVYRADDLKLGQPVALKFLAHDFAGDPERLEAFLGEVRLSLRVTHPNVCRVYDVGEVEGRHFLSMEYVDGEDLASLLRRIGRLPEDKAAQLAREMCAGLAAAHDEGVLHRDLKPANIMIDGRGRAKITDFGLAGATVGITGREAQAGTPQYMAPEQFDGGELTVRTDLYALGLVLYELFTGKPAFEGKSFLELAAKRSSLPTNPSTYVSGLNPVIERAILRCVEPDPARRPQSAEQLAASLPGGDPLAMAIAAGETPSPDLVARAGGGGELRPWVALTLLAALLASLGVVWYTSGGINGVQNRVPLPKPPAELRIDARAALTAAGYTTRGVHSASGFVYDRDYFDAVVRTDSSMGRWDSIGTVRPAPITFWYREAPVRMAPFGNVGRIGWSNPPITEAGMSRVRLDPSGRVVELLAVPASLAETPGPWPEPDWARMFAAAGFVQAEWSPAEPAWPPPHAADVRRAWTKGTLRIEATSFRGRPTWFRVFPEWSRPAPIPAARATTILGILRSSFNLLVGVLLIVGGGLIARRNVRQGRGDQRGAFRLSAAYVGVGVLYQLARLDNAPAGWLTVLQNNVAPHLLRGVLVWVSYLAVEPYVRRFWPNTLIAWSRVLEGRFRDPLVGRHILLGGLAGFAFTLLEAAPTLFAQTTIGQLGISTSAMAWTSHRAYVAALLDVLLNSLVLPVTFLLVVLLARVIFRRAWIAYAAFVLVPSLLFVGTTTLPTSIMLLVALVVILAVLTRLGLFAMLVTIVFSSWGELAFTTDVNAWFFPHSVVTMALFAALAVYGCWASLGDQKLFTESVLD